MKRLLKIVALALAGIVCLVLLVAAIALGRWYLKAGGPYPDYSLDFAKAGTLQGTPPETPLLVGVAKRDITPVLDAYDKFVDKDGDNKYNPKKGDYFEDTNKNGKLDAVWIAGFGNNRPAQGVHDPLWARAIAFENNGVRVVLVTVDSIGLFAEKIIDMRNRLDPSLKIDHLVVSSTHDHEAPDTMGIWSVGLERPFWRFDYGYMELVKRSVVEAAEEAVRNLRPAKGHMAEVTAGPEGYVDDSRIPHVYDNVVRIARFEDPATAETIATMLCWGNHPETVGSSNPLLTSDFPHFLREGVEKGVPDPNGIPGVGGMCLYFQGQVGGLMTQLHTTVPQRNTGAMLREDTFEKAQALGENVALLALGALRDGARPMTDSSVAVAAKTFHAPMGNPVFNFAVFVGLVHPGWFGGKARTEVNALRVGNLEILTVPGEIYPEICEGGVEAPAGRDFNIAPVQVPPLRSQLKGDLTMIFGLANDELGYILPKSQWDVEPPFAYGLKEDQYGEENSFGPEAGPAIHKASLEVIQSLHGALGR